MICCGGADWKYHHPSGILFLTHEFSMEPRVLDTHIDFPCFHYISRVSVQLELWYSIFIIFHHIQIPIFHHIPSYSQSFWWPFATLVVPVVPFEPPFEPREAVIPSTAYEVPSCPVARRGVHGSSIFVYRSTLW
jgi:hypothetical protein